VNLCLSVPLYLCRVIHYSVSLSGSITSFFLIIFIWLSKLLWCFIDFILFIVIIVLIIIFYLILFQWINDFWIENAFGLTRTEQFSLIYGIKLLIFSEWMLFFACFWGIINLRFILNAFSIFFCFPLLSSYSFAIPYSNLFILIYSSLPIQSASIFYKVGLFIVSIEQLGQTISCSIWERIIFCTNFWFNFLLSYLI